MVLKTRVTKMLNIEHPIIMGGMTGVGKLISRVSRWLVDKIKVMISQVQTNSF
jgi:proteasome assembly chaperone (PAC2) family protein